MREIQGDLFAYAGAGNVDAIAITTNGSIRKDGAAVMGRGVALTAKTLFPGIELILGKMLKVGGNHVYELTGGKLYRWEAGLSYRIFSLPVKHEWQQKADPILIERSLKELRQKAGAQQVALVRPGCGNGGLEWRDVRQLVEVQLPEPNYVVVEW